MKFPHMASVERMVTTGSKYIYGALGSTKCFVQPIDAETAELYAVTFTKSSVAFLPIDADVKTSDRMIVSGTTYGVKGVMSRPYGSLKHKKAILEQL